MQIVSIGLQANPYQKFKLLAESFCRLAAAEGLSVAPYQGDGPSHFAALPEADQINVLNEFQRYVEVCEEVVRNGERIGDDNQFVWRMFRRLESHPVSDLMANIQEGDVIEIYNPSFVQLFRNLRFFTICSYTLDDLLCRPFWHMYRRKEELTGKIMQVVGSVLSGEVKGITWWEIENHAVDEIDSPGMIKATVNLKFVSPLYDQNGNVAYFVNVFRCISAERTAAAP